MSSRQHLQPAQPHTGPQQHNRFSWQATPYEEALAHDEPQQHISQSQKHHSQHQPRHQPQQTQLSTDVSSRHFSYGHTPVEHRAFEFTSSLNDPPLPQQARISVAASLFTPIDARPQSIVDHSDFMDPPVPTAAYALPSYSQDEKPPVTAPPHDEPQYSNFHPQSVPVMAVPQSIPPQQFDAQDQRNVRQWSHLSPINTNLVVRPMPSTTSTPAPGTQASALPYKRSMTPISVGPTKYGQPQDGPTSPPSSTPYANEPYLPHGFTSNQTNNNHAVFSPDAAHGPNGLDSVLHQPGQIAHPNMESERSHEWRSTLCSCSPSISTCLTGLFCPCILYGRTSYRLSQKSAKKDPTDMLGHSSTNGHCMLMALSCGLWWLFPMLQRTRIRRAYKLDGNLGSDLLKGCCCCCCVTVQNEREVKGREEASRRWAGPASTDIYTRSGAMLYKPQR